MCNCTSLIQVICDKLRIPIIIPTGTTKKVIQRVIARAKYLYYIYYIILLAIAKAKYNGILKYINQSKRR